MRKLNEKGFAVSVILYAAVILVVLILYLILSILATSTKNKMRIVDSIKEEVSGNVDNKGDSLGDLNMAVSDNIGSGAWHSGNFNLTLSSPNDNLNLVYFYGTDYNNITAKMPANKVYSVSSNIKNVTYYFKACKDSAQTVCTKTAHYLVNRDSSMPSFTITRTGTKQYTISNINSLSGIAKYQFFVSNFTANPSENDQFSEMEGNLTVLTVTEPGTYMHIRAISKAGLKSEWQLVTVQ